MQRYGKLSVGSFERQVANQKADGFWSIKKPTIQPTNQATRHMRRGKNAIKFPDKNNNTCITVTEHHLRNTLALLMFTD